VLYLGSRAGVDLLMVASGSSEALPNHLLKMPDAVLAPSCSMMGINHELAGLVANRVQTALDTLCKP